MKILHRDPAKMLKGDLAKILTEILNNRWASPSYYMRNYTKLELISIYKDKIEGIIK